MTDTHSRRRTARRAARKLRKTLAPRPKGFCLISGAPRSGTTAVARWLTQQEKVSGFSESRILVAAHRFLEEAYRFQSLKSRPKLITAAARQLIYDYYAYSEDYFNRNIGIDKEPLEPIAFPDKQYGQFLENVNALIPEAKFLLMIRDPIATVWSMRQRKWGMSLTNAQARNYSISEHTENWCSCAELVIQYCSHPNAYVCQYGRLIDAPQRESARVFNFLGITGKSFEPHHNLQKPGFSREEQEWILQTTRETREKLANNGISDLCSRPGTPSYTGI